MPIVIKAGALLLVTQALNFAMELYDQVRASQEGKDLPDWDKISNRNAILQGRIDQEKAKLGLV